MEFTILGKAQLRIDGRLADLGTTKTRLLLALLLLHVGRRVPVSMIVDQLWPGRSPDEVRGLLQSQVSRLRATLDRAGVPHRLPPHELGAYRLELEPQLVDYHRFRRQAEAGRAAARAGDHNLAISLLQSAIGVWQGEPLAELRTDWAAQRRDQMLRDDLLPAHYALIESQLRLRDYATVLNQIGPLMDDYPLDETLALHRMLALDGIGRPSDATSFFARFRQRMLVDLGMEPGPELHEAHRYILRRRTLTDGSPALTVKAVDRPPVWQLPRVVHNLAGRDDLLAILDMLLLDHDPNQPAPVVALHGMPGIGKTSLAVFWGYRRRDRFPDGCLFLNVHGYGPNPPVSADDAIARCLESLDVPAREVPPPGPRRTDKLNRMLAGRKILVLLDNVRDPAHVRPVLSAISSCPVLTTSRAMPTGLVIRDGVRSVVVAPMSIEDSAALLCEDIGDRRATDDRASVTALAASSGGLPLALKLIGQIAANRPHTSLADIARELDTCNALLEATGEDTELDTLQGAFFMSVSALPPEAAAVLPVLGLHPRPSFSRHAACALAGQDLGETERLLKILTEVHLLEQEGFHRYRFHDLLHAYAANRSHRDLPTEEQHDAVERLADFYCRSASAAWRMLVPHGQPVPALPTHTKTVPLVFDTDNEALQWCAKERGNLVAVTLLAANYQFHEYAWRIPAIMGEAVERWGFRDDFLDSVHVALQSARVVGNREAEIGMLNYLGGSFFVRHNYRGALTQFTDALAIAQQAGHREGLSVSLHNVASASLELGDSEEAIRLYRQSLDLKRQLAAPGGAAHCLHRIALAHQRSGRYDEALDHYRQALKIRENIDDLRGQGDTLNELGALYHELGEYDLARDHCRRALKAHERSQDIVKEIKALTILAAVHYDTGMSHESAACAERAVEQCKVTADPIALARALHVLGRARNALGASETARDAWMRAAQIFDDASSPEAHALWEHIAELDARPRPLPSPGIDGGIDQVHPNGRQVP